MRKNGERTAVVLDGQPLWIEALEQLLQPLGLEVVGKTTDPEHALALVAEHHPDVLLTDFSVSNGGLDAMECMTRAQQSHPSLKAVVLASSAHPDDIETAFAAGASVYCVKTANPDDLLAAIRQAFEKSIYLAHSIQTPATPPSATSAGQVPALTRREREILQLVAEGHSNSQLARMLWVTEQTVKFHLSNIYRKLDVANRTEASRWAQLNGLLPPGPRLVASTAA
jgi:DNA-binding NarL/FixJ family response regulator